jgi:quercetin dioxygenase-like cupin family protein
MHQSVDVAHGHKPHSVGGGQIEKGVVHVPPGEGASSLWVFGEHLIHKIPSQQTGGAYALFEVTTQPGGGPPPHVQHREDETFYVLEGQFELLSGEETQRVGVGSLIYVPKGTLHTHKNVGEGVGRMLLSQTPGGLYEHFFEGIGKPADGDGGPLDAEAQTEVGRSVEVAAKYGIEILPPIAEKVWPRGTTKGVQQ